MVEQGGKARRGNGLNAALGPFTALLPRLGTVIYRAISHADLGLKAVRWRWP
jgi:hypothetical protein